MVNNAVNNVVASVVASVVSSHPFLAFSKGGVVMVGGCSDLPLEVPTPTKARNGVTWIRNSGKWKTPEALFTTPSTHLPPHLRMNKRRSLLRRPKPHFGHGVVFTSPGGGILILRKPKPYFGHGGGGGIA